MDVFLEAAFNGVRAVELRLDTASVGASVTQRHFGRTNGSSVGTAAAEVFLLDTLGTMANDVTALYIGAADGRFSAAGQMPVRLPGQLALNLFVCGVKRMCCD